MLAEPLSRLLFALTAGFHFIFVPLTLGLSLLIAIMETIYLYTGNEKWKKAVKFWGLLFGINFAIGVATGIPLEFQFGTNWAYYSHFTGDIFGAPLAVEGLVAFFLESTFIGLFFFGWKKLTPKKHLLATWLMATGATLSALWILIANGWMQNPVGAAFNPQTMRMELTNFYEIVMNPFAQAAFIHTTLGAYALGGFFVIGVSSFYLLRKRDVEIAKRSLVVAAPFALIMSLAVALSGDVSAKDVAKYQPAKLAAFEMVYDTHSYAGLSLFAIRNKEKDGLAVDINIPGLLSFISFGKFSAEVKGINDIVAENKEKIIHGLSLYGVYEDVANDPHNKVAGHIVKENIENISYASLLLKQKTQATISKEDIEKAAMKTVPEPFFLYWSFRIMVGFGMLMILLSFIYTLHINKLDELSRKRNLLKIGLFFIPFPYIAIQCGWFVTEFGRQPWSVYGLLPTSISASDLPGWEVAFTIVGFGTIYTIFFILDIFLLLKYIKIGPEQLQKKKS